MVRRWLHNPVETIGGVIAVAVLFTGATALAVLTGAFLGAM